MTLHALITGRLIADPECRTSTGGKAYTVARAAAGTDDESVICSVIAFGHVGEQLAALAKGDSLALVGRTKPKAWVDREGQPRAGLDVFADQLLTVYHVRKRRHAMAPTEEPPP